MRRPLAARRFAAIAVSGLLAIAATSCAEPVPDRDELAEALQDSGLSASVARCTADAITENLSDDELAQIAERGPGGAPRDDPDETDDSTDQVREAMAICRAELPTTTTVPVATSTTTVGGIVDDGASFDTAPTTGADSSTTVAPDADGTEPAPTAAP